MRHLTGQEIEKLASRKGVKRIAVENFLMSLGDGLPIFAKRNADADASSYKWNSATIKAIKDGIDLASR